MTTRIYEVNDSAADVRDGPRLIEATSVAHAIRIAIDERFTASVASPKRVAELMELDVKVEYIAEPAKPEVVK